MPSSSLLISLFSQGRGEERDQLSVIVTIENKLLLLLISQFLYRSGISCQRFCQFRFWGLSNLILAFQGTFEFDFSVFANFVFGDFRFNRQIEDEDQVEAADAVSERGEGSLAFEVAWWTKITSQVQDLLSEERRGRPGGRTGQVGVRITLELPMI